MKIANNCQIVFWILCLLFSELARSRTLNSTTRSAQSIAGNHKCTTRMERRLRRLSMLSSLKDKALNMVGLGSSPLQKTKTRYLMQLRTKEAEINQIQAENSAVLEEALKRVDFFDLEFLKTEAQFSSQLLQLQLDVLKLSEKIRVK